MTAVPLALVLSAAATAAPVLNLRATIGGTPIEWTVMVFRWSTEAERTPVLNAMAPAAPTPAPAPGGDAAGRAGRAGRGAAPAPPLSPASKVSASIKAAPTLGYIWTEGVTGYSIKYAWRAPEAGAADRIVLITDRRLVVNVPQADSVPGVGADAEFTLIEMRLDAAGKGEGKTSLTTNLAADPAAKTLALDGYASAPALFRITR
jgi:hypothetical protein